MAVDTTSPSKKRKSTDPPDGYVCNLCKVSGHWIQQCPEKAKSNSNKRKKTDHQYVTGVDPSQEDIDRARDFQKIPAPDCFCGQPSRLKKVKQSHVNATSRAVGKYFFFCTKKKNDSPCRFARPVREIIKEIKRKDKKTAETILSETGEEQNEKDDTTGEVAKASKKSGQEENESGNGSDEDSSSNSTGSDSSSQSDDDEKDAK
jgi:hypothetical protein